MILAVSYEKTESCLVETGVKCKFYKKLNFNYVNIRNWK
jgi:hypothetical protein